MHDTCYNGAISHIVGGGEMGSDTKLLTIRAPDDLHRQVKAKAALEDVTISQVVRWWLRAWVDGELPTRPPSLNESEH